MSTTKTTTIALMLAGAILLMAVGSFFTPNMMGEHGGQPCVFQVMQQVACNNNTVHWETLQSLLVAASTNGMMAVVLAVLALLLWSWIVQHRDPDQTLNLEPGAAFQLRHQRETLFCWAAPLRAWTARTQDLQ